MASSYTGLGTELMTTGENAGTWGTTTNTNIQILEQISGGYTAQSIAGSAQTTTLSVSDGSTGAVLAHKIIEFTGTITGNQIVTIPLDVQTFYIVKNNTSGAYTVQFKYVSGSGSSVTWAATDKGTKLLYATADDGTNPNLVDSNIGGVGAVDLDGNELTLDADSDTSITASTDDQIDFEISGADDFTMTANAFNVATGSAVTFADSCNAKFGTGNDMLMYHDGTNSYITNAQGALKVATETSGIAVTIGHTTSETTVADNFTTTGDTSVGGTLGVTGVATFATHVALGDSDILKLGAAPDMQLYHDGSNSYITNATGALKIATESSGIAVTIGHSTSEVTVADNLTVTGTLTLGSNAELTEAELELLDGLTAGTAIASKVVTTDASIDTTGQRNLTISGELDAATLDISGNADIDGTMEADAYTIEGTSFIKLGGTDFDGGLLIGHSTTGTLSSALRNTGVGTDTLDALTSGDFNTAVGNLAGTSITSGGSNTCIGKNSGYTLATGSGNTFLGQDSGKVVTGSNNICIGHEAGEALTSGAGNVLIGQGIEAASNSGSQQLKIAGNNDSSTVNWIIGDSSGNLTFPAEVAAVSLDISGAIDVDGTTNLDAVDIDGAVQIDGTVTVGVDDTGLDVKLFGAAAGAYGLYDQSENAFEVRGATAAGAGLLKLTTGELTVVDADKLGRIDFQAPLESDGTDAVAIAASIWAEADDTFSSSVNNTDLVFALGKSEAAAEKFRLTADGEIGLGGANYGTDGQVLTSAGAGAAAAWETVAGGLTGKVEGTNFTDSLLVGHSTTGTLDVASQNTGVGIDALDAITSGDGNTAIGFEAGTAINSAAGNTVIGDNAGEALTSGGYNVGVGQNAVKTCSTSAQNTGVGAFALQLATGGNNTGVGKDAGASIAGGAWNTCIGMDSGQNITSGSGNIIIGGVDADSATGSHQLKINGYNGSSHVLWIDGDSSGNITFPADVTLGDDLLLDSDSAVLKFGDDQDVTITHDPDDGLFFKSAATADNNPFLLTLQTGETDMAADDVIGKIAFQAPDEGEGTDAILVSAAVQAVAEGNHSASSNATRLEFMTGASEAATTKMTLTSAGLLGIATDSPTQALTIEGAGKKIAFTGGGVQSIYFGDAGSAYAGYLHYSHTSDELNADSTGSIYLDAATDITLDAGGADIVLADDATTFGSLTNSSGELVVKSGSTPTTAMTFSGANVTLAGTAHSEGGQLSTTGKAMVLGF